MKLNDTVPVAPETPMQRIESRSMQIRDRIRGAGSRLAELVYAMDSSVLPPKADQACSDVCVGNSGFINSIKRVQSDSEDELVEVENLLSYLEDIIKQGK